MKQLTIKDIEEQIEKGRKAIQSNNMEILRLIGLNTKIQESKEDLLLVVIKSQIE